MRKRGRRYTGIDCMPWNDNTTRVRAKGNVERGSRGKAKNDTQIDQERKTFRK